MRSSKRELSLRGVALAATIVSIAAAVGCGGSSSSSNNNNNNNNNNQVIAGPGPNVATITAGAGPTGGYLNGVFVSVNVCVPGTATCQTIDNVLLDTGSFGLRLLDSSNGGEFNRATVPLVQSKDGTGNPIGECVQFVDNSFLWGPVATADVKISGEVASSVPVHIVGDANFTFQPGTGCSGNDVGNISTLGTNGILGVGSLQQDCPGCVTQAVSGAYYSCPAAGCTPITMPLAQQVQNPVALFATDNNGVIVELPTVPSGGAVSIPSGTIPSGALVFGIGTQSNNALGSASVLTLDSNLFLSVSLKGTSYPQSFIDSGSNALFFSDNATTGMPACQSGAFFYCPSSPQNFTGTNQGANGTSTTTNFTIVSLDSQPAANWVFNNVGGPGNSQSFDWGLPFFMGRNVFVSIAGKTAPGGTPPYVAY